ncbi:MAG: FapA family protein [Candidatus Marinimicrobia bacterium]|nr:FapA family protein [Candidatus Neomarinimicrobiota bacterium]MCF7880491.1 FapA family protein [Candidatus Neomarinimicrobiota bacterium]
MNPPSKNQISLPPGLGLAEREGKYTLSLTGNPEKQAEQILGWIISAEIVGLDIPLLSKIFLNKYSNDIKEPIPIGTVLQHFRAETEQLMKVEIADDEMRAWIHVKAPPAGVPLTADDCLFYLLQNGVKAGFQARAIEKALQGDLPIYKLVAAIGQPARSGEDGEILYHDALNGEEASNSWHPFNVVTVHENEILAQKLPAVSGEVGFTVLGKHLDASVLDPEFPPGENTYVADDGLTLYASTDGYIYWEQDELSVREVLRISGDVDFNSGNIDYCGSILVEGDIRSGHSVRSENSIEVRGCIEGADVTAGEDINIKSGINGLEHSQVTSGGNVSVDYIQDATIEAGGSVTVHRYISRGNIQAKGKIIVEGHAGLIRGGTTWSETQIRMNVAGSTACIPTTFIIRPNLTKAQLQQLESIQQKLAGVEQTQNQVRRRLEYLTLLEKRQRRLDANHRNEAELHADKLVSLSEEIVHLQNELETIQSVRTRALESEVPFIVIHNKIYPGVRFIIGNHELLIQEEIPGGVVHLINDQLFIRRNIEYQKRKTQYSFERNIDF